MIPLGVRSALRELFRAEGQPVEEAARAQSGPAQVPERAGFEYGIPAGGLTEYRQSVGGATNSNRRTMLQELYEAYLSCPWSWACVNAIARTITAGGLVTEWDNDDEEGDQDAPPKPDNVQAMERLFAYTNPREDIRQLMRGVITDLLVFGDAYIEVSWVGNIPVALYSLDSPSMAPIADEHGVISGYVQTTEFGQRAQFEPRDVIHISLDSPRSGIFGVSPTQANLVPITAWLFAASTAKELFRKGNPANIHIDFPASMSASEMNRWLAMYQANNLGPQNIGNPVVTKGGGKVNELKMGAIGEYLDFLSQKRDEILAGYGVPPAEAGVIESGNLGGGTGESQRKSFLTNTCQPIGGLVLEKIQYHIAVQGFGVEGWSVKFSEIDMRDSKIIEDIRDMRIRNGTYSLNKARTEIGEPPVDGGNEAVIIDRTNLVLWRDLAAMSQATVAAKAKDTAFEPDQPQEGQAVKLVKAEKPTPPPVAPPLPGAPVPGQPEPPTGGRHRAPGEEETTESVFSSDWGRLAGDWSEYRRRRAQALEELPASAGAQ